MAGKFQVSFPKKAALACLKKSKQVADLGVCQALFPLYYRDYMAHIPATDRELVRLFKESPQELMTIFSSAFAWMANAWTATTLYHQTSPTIHITPANLATHAHRAMDVTQTLSYLQQWTGNMTGVQYHAPLATHYPDEGGANMICLGPGIEEGPSLYLLIYGASLTQTRSKNETGRQHEGACRMIQAKHKIPAVHCQLIQQSPVAIAAGVFHNDVIAFGGGSLLVVHEAAWVNIKETLMAVSDRYQQLFAETLTIVCVKQQEFSLQDAVSCYFFNSQYIPLPAGGYALLCPSRCRDNPKVAAIMKQLARQSKLEDVLFVDVEDSIRNGGGPACLRNYLECSTLQQSQLNPAFQLTSERYKRLVDVINQYYPTQLDCSHFMSHDTIQAMVIAQQKMRDLMLSPLY